MDKRYQVFVSSTYTDLMVERKSVTQTLMELDCIPAGMELFPAVDEEQWSFIKKIIDDSDYYLLIVGGRYGSLGEEGLSYTEMEFDYAIEKGIKVIALLHGSPEKLSVEKSEISAEAREKLQVFRDKVSAGRLVKYWSESSELPGLVSLSLNKTMKIYPAVGWIRASEGASEDLLKEINDLRKENAALSQELAQFQSSKQTIYNVPDLAGFDEVFTLNGEHWNGDRTLNWSVELTWEQIFYYVSPYLLSSRNESFVKDVLLEAACVSAGYPTTMSAMQDQDFQTVAIQLKVLGLVVVDISGSGGDIADPLWKLTSEGEKVMVGLRTVKKSNA
ncbi:DUF4062 domain-containing protein [Pseudomonas sp. CFBP 5750]